MLIGMANDGGEMEASEAPSSKMVMAQEIKGKPAPMQ